MLVLGIESSCDETSVAIVEDGKKVLSNVTISQIDIHKKFGGVVPEIASRNHVYQISLIFKEAFNKANKNYNDIDLVAVTNGPGLIGSLLVGTSAAKTFAMCFNKPIIGVNHLCGHIYANMIENDIKFPCIVLLISGGNTELIYMKDHFSFEIIGQTLDDAVGECIDKVARLLGITYPGGPMVDKLAKEGYDEYRLTKPLCDDNNFSFSGLKSQCINMINTFNMKKEKINVNNFCCSLQNTITKILVDKTIQASRKFKVNQILVCGGVSANSKIKEEFLKYSNEFQILIPKLEYCTDNAAMIACCGYYKSKYFKYDDLSLNADASLDLE